MTSRGFFFSMCISEPLPPLLVAFVSTDLANRTMIREADPESWNLDYLRKRCAEESKRFFQRKDHDTRFCFELFRRAVLDQDEEAWEYVYQQYQPLVASWVENHAVFPALSEEKAYFVNRAFEKMWVSISPTKFSRFTNVNSLLQYLKMCAGSVIIDHGRTRARRKLEIVAEQSDIEVQDDIPAVEEQVFDRVQSQALWNRVKALTSNTKEYRVLYGSYVLDLKPQEILETYPGDFQSVKEVYRVKENLLQRLRRNQELIYSFAEYAEGMD